jgi:hypothetical protein
MMTPLICAQTKYAQYLRRRIEYFFTKTPQQIMRTLSKPLHQSGWLVALLGSLTLATGCASISPSGKGRVVDKEGKPLAGVHVESYRTSNLDPIRVVGKEQTCHDDHYSLTGEDGMFDIPYNVLKRPWITSMSIFNVVAYKPGMMEEDTTSSVARRPLRPNGDEDFVLTKEKPIMVTVVLVPDMRSFTARANYVNKLHGAGCSCSDFSKSTWVEFERLVTLSKPERTTINTGTASIPSWAIVGFHLQLSSEKNRCDVSEKK